MKSVSITYPSPMLTPRTTLPNWWSRLHTKLPESPLLVARQCSPQFSLYRHRIRTYKRLLISDQYVLNGTMVKSPQITNERTGILPWPVMGHYHVWYYYVEGNRCCGYIVDAMQFCLAPTITWILISQCKCTRTNSSWIGTLYILLKWLKKWKKKKCSPGGIAPKLKKNIA